MPFILLVLAVVLVLAIAIPLLVAVASVTAAAFPWLLFAFVVWVVLLGGRSRRRRSWRRREWRPAPMPVDHSANGHQQPALPEHRGPDELPFDVQMKIDQIRRKVDLLLGYGEKFPPFSRDLYVVQQTASEYLPRTVSAYLALPSGYRERIVVANGKTALQELREQLDLLDGKLNEIAVDLQKQDLDRLLANRRFLEERFGRAAAETAS